MRFTAPVRLALLATLLAATPVLAGPPWISIEYPANPYDRTTKGALLTLHTYHHGLPMDAVVTARADGIVGGVRRTISLTVGQTGRPGVMAVSGELPAGQWVITSTMGEPGSDARASALLALDAEGRPTALTVPLVRRGEWIIPREATAADVETLLRGGRGVAAAGPGPALPPVAQLASVSGLAALGLLVARRRRNMTGRAAQRQH